MSEADPTWSLFSAFVAVMREGSLSAAARSLSVTQPTVRRQVERLESVLGVTLFTRGPNGLVPTQTARAAMPYAESIEATAAALLRAVTGPSHALAGAVRVTCSEVVGTEVLPGVLVELRARYPEIAVELAPTNRLEDLVRRDADVAVRMARPTQEALLVKRVGSARLGLFAHERYVRERGAPGTLAELARGHALVGDDRAGRIAAALGDAGGALDPRRFSWRTDDDRVQLALVRAGAGVGVCQLAIARREPALVRVVPPVEFALEVYVVMHEDQRDTARVRAYFDGLARALADFYEEPRPGAPARAKR